MLGDCYLIRDEADARFAILHSKTTRPGSQPHYICLRLLRCEGLMIEPTSLNGTMQYVTSTLAAGQAALTLQTRNLADNIYIVERPALVARARRVARQAGLPCAVLERRPMIARC